MNSPLAKHVLAKLFAYNPNDSYNVTLYGAIFTNDISTVREILETERSHVFSPYKMPILSLAIISRNYEMVQFLIDIGCKMRQADKMHRATPMHWAVFNEFACELHQPNSRRIRSATTCVSCALTFHNPNLVKLLIENQSCDDAFDNIFIDVDRYMEKTPFERACILGCDAIIQIFFDFVSSRKNEISTENLLANGGNIFRSYFAHAFSAIFGGLRINGNWQEMKPRQGVIDYRMSTLRAVIESMPHLEHFLTSSAGPMPPPLELLFMPTIAFGQSKEQFRRLIDLLKWIADRGVPLDTVQRDSRGFLEIAVASQNEEFVEMLLRLGCQIRYGPFSTLSVALFRGVRRRLRPHRPSIHIIELLLAFGLDLNKEMYLHSDEELPVNSSFRNQILVALRGLRRSNRLISLQRLCRKSIRDQLKPRADQVIEKLDWIEPALKKYLLVANEPDVLEIKGQSIV